LGASDDGHQRRREPVAAELGEGRQIKAGVSFQTTIEIVAEPVMSGDLVDQLEHDAGAEAVDTFG
jgi:hypothetical protein